MPNLYSISYFGGFDARRFDIIGGYRNRASVVARLSQVAGHPLDSDERENVTPPTQERQSVEADDALKSELQDILIDNVRFFETYAEGRCNSAAEPPVFLSSLEPARRRRCGVI